MNPLNQILVSFIYYFLLKYLNLSFRMVFQMMANNMTLPFFFIISFNIIFCF